MSEKTLPDNQFSAGQKINIIKYKFLTKGKFTSIPSLIIIGIIFLVLNCATLPNGRRRGQDITLTPGWE